MAESVQEVAKRARRKRCLTTAVWALWNILPTLVPTGVLALMLHFSTKQWEWPAFIRQGEFALYSVGVIIPAFYTFLDESNPHTRRSSSHERMLVLWFGGLMFLVGVVLFSRVAMLSNEKPEPGSQLTAEKLATFGWWTVILFLVSTIYACGVFFRTQATMRYDPVEARAEDDVDLEAKFDKLGQ